MIRFYTNRELSRKLAINLAKWKRWSREFLPPDPLGGMQSGYARQYNPDEAFTVYLGGYLVGELKFTIPEARQILKDLHVWLLEHGFYFGISDTERSKLSANPPVSNHRISIRGVKGRKSEHLGFIYTTRGIITERELEYEGTSVQEEHYIESRFGLTATEPEKAVIAGGRVIHITELRDAFLACLQAPAPTDANGP